MDIQYCVPIDDEISTFESIPAALEQQLKKKEVIGISFSENFSETITIPTRSYTASHTPDDENLDDGSNGNDRIIESIEPQAIDDFAVRLYTFALVEEPKYNQFCQLILATKSSDSISGFYERDNGRLRCRHLSISALQQFSFYIASEVDYFTMARHHELAGHPVVTRTPVIVQHTYQWP